MSNIKHWEEKIKQRRLHTPFREFIRDFASKVPIMLYRHPQGVSRYPVSDRIITFPTDEFELMKDDFVKNGLEYDFGKSLFDNYAALLPTVGAPLTMKDPKAENADYSEATRFSNNVYLSFIVIEDCEDILYTFYAQQKVKNTLNSVMVWDNSEVVYYSTAIIHSYEVFYSRYIVDSSRIWFSSNLMGCRDCIFCNDLQNQQYYIKNIPYTKEEYKKKKQEILAKKSFFQGYYEQVNTEANNFASEGVQGNFCVYSENVTNGYFCYRVRNAHNAYFVGDKNGRNRILDTVCSDQSSPGDIYGCTNLGTSENCYLSEAFIGRSLYYCFNLINCNFCLGCIGLENKSYCILNKQYTKEEWYFLANRIFEQMDVHGILGDPLPATLNPYYFNDTLAYLVDNSFTKEEVSKAGFMWRDTAISVDIPANGSIISIKDLDTYEKDTNGVWKINPEILQKVVVDEDGNYYKVIPQELEFLEKYGLPLPTKHWLDRIRDGLRI